MKKILLLFVLLSEIISAQSTCNPSSFNPITVCPLNATISIAQNVQTDLIYVCGQNAVVYDTLTPPSIKYRQVFINSGGRYYFKSTITNNNVTVFAKNGSFCFINGGSSTGLFTLNQEPTATLINMSTGTVTTNACSAITNPTTTINCTTSGVTEIQNNVFFMVSPNPGGGNFIITSAIPLSGEIILCDQLGKTVLAETITEIFSREISLEKLSSGLYYLTVRTANGSKTQKVALEN
jgi:hypothetical protein